MSPTELTDRYVHAVTLSMRAAERADVARELRSLVSDMAADRAPGGEPDEATVVAILRELGRPEVVAERYGQPRPYLIGPSYFQPFKAVTAIVLAIVGIAYLIGIVFSFAFADPPPSEPLASLADSMWGLGSIALANLGLMVLIFALIERLAPAGGESDEDWDPLELPSVDDPDRLDRLNQAFELGFDVAAMAVFNAIVRGGLPILVIADESVQRFAFDLSADFLAWVPWINATFVLGIALSALLLARGRWSLPTRAAYVAVNLFSLVVLVQVLGLPEIAAVEWVDVLARVGLAVVIIIVVIDTANHVWRLVRRATSAYTGSDDLGGDAARGATEPGGR